MKEYTGSALTHKFAQWLLDTEGENLIDLLDCFKEAAKNGPNTLADDRFFHAFDWDTATDDDRRDIFTGWLTVHVVDVLDAWSDCRSCDADASLIERLAAYAIKEEVEWFEVAVIIIDDLLERPKYREIYDSITMPVAA